MNNKLVNICRYALFALVIGCNGAMAQNGNHLRIKITGLQSGNGQINVAVFAKEDGFPSDDAKAVDRLRFTLDNQREAVIELPNLAFGNYAISCYHDENSNDELDRNIFGMPKEGVGFSNNPKFGLRPPAFEKSRFLYDANRSDISIAMSY